ncbi:MAG TPA: CoA transferase [Methylomirabilota bacterium]|jgi:crotonobetainyl-CoA:carnitine CoA-transferase CaiB-like acyl-CoA transferase|nr:CoA transferase [Methylomirabilota bacterium]
MPGPLNGVRIIDCTTVVLGPWAGQQLGDLGADVIKVEPPDGDTTRQLGPMRNPGMGAFYLAVNRNKRSIVLDLKQESARQVLLKLASKADVLLHNYRPRAAKRLGLSYDMFRAVNPGIIYVGTYGFRASGPYADKPAYDDIIQAASGLASLQSALTGEPRFVPTIVADKTSSMTLFAAVLAALYHKARTGEGQEVEVPMFESLAAWVMVEHLYGESFVPAVETVGYKRVLSPHRKPFKTKDGHLAILPYTDQNWRDFFAIAGRQDLLDDPRFKSLASRLRHIDFLYGEVAKIALTRTNAEWLAELDRANIPGMTVNSLESLLRDPHLEATGFWQEMKHPSEGPMRLPGIPAAYGKTPADIRRHPPRLGEHTLEVLREAGLSTAEIDALLATGATRTESSKGASA